MRLQLHSELAAIDPKLDLVAQGISAVTLDVENVLTNYKDPEVHPEALDFVDALKSAGLLVALATNSQDVFQIDKVRQQLDGIKAYFPTDLVRGKTHPDMFALAAKAFDILPERIAHVDDQFKAFIGARNAGFGQGIWLTTPYGENQHRGVMLARPAEKVLQTAIKCHHLGKSALSRLTTDPFNMTD